MPKDKKFEDLSSEDLKDIKIVFAPGSFDSFEGTQEELDKFQAEIIEMFRSGEAQKIAKKLDLEELFEDNPEEAERIFNTLNQNTSTRILQ